MDALGSTGFLATRGDFMSDLLIVVLALVVPALVVGVIAARRRMTRIHRIVMLSVYSALLGYVVVYEANMLRLGGIDFLRSRLAMPETPYFVATAVHVALGSAALVLGFLVLRQGSRLLSGAPGPTPRPGVSGAHRRSGRVELGLLVASVATGLVIYYLTFVHVS